MTTQKARILIVEDELLIAKNTAKKLERFGYDVVKIVSTGQAAIDFVSLEFPDLILMDIAIKGEIDGIETASQIKYIADIPVIFMTAYANDQTLDRASDTGCYGYLIKPYKEKELQATVKMTLSKHAEQSAIQSALQSTIHEYSEQYDDIYKDSITGLPNKLFLRDLFDYLLSVIEQHTEFFAQDIDAATDSEQEPQLKLVSVFNIHLDRWEKACTFLDKEQQDDLTKEIATRLTDRVYDFSTHGSTVFLKPDNFVVLLAVDQQKTAQEYGQDLLHTLQKNYIIGEREIFLSPSIGISFCPRDSSDVEELLEQGGKAIEYSKTQGGNRCQTFSLALNIQTFRGSHDLNLESELHHALDRREFELFYQPKLDLKTNSVIGAEALIRWNHHKMGRIPANKFIPLAEDIGLIKPIGNWVLKTACQQLKVWHSEGLKMIKMAVNLSGAQFRQLDLFHQITQVLFDTSLEAQYLELELTENILVENIKTNVQRLNLLKKLGVDISLDDFGTGYSSLGYLQQFPFDILKLDACFIRDIHKNHVNAVITKSVIEMAHQLGLKVVAEGIETRGELNFLKEAKCDAIQGFLFSRPLTGKEFKKLVADNISSSRKVTMF